MQGLNLSKPHIMEPRENIQEELTQIAPALVNMPVIMPFAVPAGYFDELPLQVLSKTTIQEIKTGVPEGYFDAFAGNMLLKIKAMAAEEDELAFIAPALQGISRSIPYSVPRGYFENFTAATGAQDPTLAPVIPVNRSFRTFKWVAAASVIILAGLFTWKFSGNTPDAHSGQALAGITDSTDASILAALQNIGDTSIDTELNTNGLAEDTRSALFYLNTENFETALHDFSDEEIKSQLAEGTVIKNKS